MLGSQSVGVSVVSRVHFGRGLFCYSNSIFFYIEDTEKTKFYCQKQSLESLTIP